MVERGLGKRARGLHEEEDHLVALRDLSVVVVARVRRRLAGASGVVPPVQPLTGLDAEDSPDGVLERGAKAVRRGTGLEVAVRAGA